MYFVNKCHTPIWHHLIVMRHSSKTLTQNGLCVWEFSISRCASRVLWAYVIAISVLCHHVEKLWNVVLSSEWSMLQINSNSYFSDNWEWEIVTHILIANLNVCLQKQIKHFHLIKLLVAKMQNVSKLQTSAILKIDDAAMAKVLLSGIFGTLQPLYLVD